MASMQRIDSPSALRPLARQVSDGATVDEVLESIFEDYRSRLPFTRLGYAEIDHDSGMVTARWGRSTRPIKLTRGYSAKLKGSSLELIANRQAPRVLNDLRQYLKHRPDSMSTRIIVQEGIQSSLTCPIIVAKRPIGFLFFSHHCPQTYSEEKLDAFLGISDLLAHQVVITKSDESHKRTLQGTISTLANVLAIANPLASEHSEQIRELVRKFAKNLKNIDADLMEQAARLSHLGFIPISEETTRRVFSGEDLSEFEREQVATQHQVGARLLQPIPALQDVATIVEAMDDHMAADSKAGQSESAPAATLLKAFADFRLLVARGTPAKEAWERLLPAVDRECTPFERSLPDSSVPAALRKESKFLTELAPGMILNQHLTSRQGDILLSRGVKLTPALVEKLQEAVVKRKTPTGRISVLVP